MNKPKSFILEAFLKSTPRTVFRNCWIHRAASSFFTPRGALPLRYSSGGHQWGFSTSGFISTGWSWCRLQRKWWILFVLHEFIRPYIWIVDLWQGQCFLSMSDKVQNQYFKWLWPFEVKIPVRFSHCIYSFCSIEFTKSWYTWRLTPVACQCLTKFITKWVMAPFHHSYTNGHTAVQMFSVHYIKFYKGAACHPGRFFSNIYFYLPATSNTK